MIHEVIVTTLDKNNGIHIAPMGIRWTNNDLESKEIIISPFRPSTTLDNLVESKKAVVNLIDDVRVFAGIVTKKRKDWDIDKSNVHYPFLKDTNTYIPVHVKKITEDDVRPKVICDQIDIISLKPFLGFNRAQSAVIEGAVLTSRLGMIDDEKIKEEIKYLEIAINKTSGTREQEAWNWIIEKIDNYFINNEH